MNYLFLKNILESLFSNFRCPHCGATPNESSVHIDAVTATTIDVRIHCQSCHQSSLMKAELTQMTPEFLGSPEGKQFIENYNRNQKTTEVRFHAHEKSPSPESTGAISLEDIKKIDESIQPHTTIQDLIDGQ